MLPRTGFAGVVCIKIKDAQNEEATEESEVPVESAVKDAEDAQAAVAPKGGESDAEGQSSEELPEDWELRFTKQGRRFYLDHSTKTTHWKLPSP